MFDTKNVVVGCCRGLDNDGIRQRLQLYVQYYVCTYMYSTLITVPRL